MTSESPGPWFLKDQVPTHGMAPAVAFSRKCNEWHMKCITCPDKVEIRFSSDISMMDLLPKRLHGKKQPQYPSGTSTTFCPPCQSKFAGDANAFGCSTDVPNDYSFHKSCLELSQFVTIYGERIPLIEIDSKVLHYNLSDAMALIKPKDQKFVVRIFRPSDTCDY